MSATESATATQVEVAAATAVKFYVRTDVPYTPAAALTVGQEMGYAKYTRFLGESRIGSGGVSKVARVLKTQVVLENGMRFNTRGEEVGGDSYGKNYLIDPAALAANQAADAAARAAADALIELRLAVDELRFVKGPVAAETKDKLAALVAALAVHPTPAAM